MAGKGDGGNLRQERGQRISDLGLQAVYKGTGRGKLSFGKCSELERKKGYQVGQDANQRGKNSWCRKGGNNLYSVDEEE